VFAAKRQQHITGGSTEERKREREREREREKTYS
jgi:hypothetical protein